MPDPVDKAGVLGTDLKFEESEAFLSNRLESAFDDYLALTRRAFQQGKGGWDKQDRLHLLLSKEELLRRLVEDLEKSKEFAELAAATARDYHHDQPDPRVGGRWERHAGDYLRLSGLYLNLFFEGKAPPLAKVVEQYRAAFRAKNQTITYLAPLEFVEFRENVIHCDGFEVRRFSEAELDTIIQNRARKIFYKWAHVRSAEIEPYWFVYVKETVPAKEPGKMSVVLNFRIQICYSQYPHAVQKALERLALYDWASVKAAQEEARRKDVDPSSARQPKPVPPQYKAWQGPFCPRAPFVISCSDSMIERPAPTPDLSVLAKETICETTEVPWRELSLDERETQEFQAFMQRCAKMLKLLEAYRNQWGFVETALGFLLKAFTAQGLEQLLWHITAIEAVFGERLDAGLTKLLRTRVSTVVGGTEDGRKQVGRRFDSLYSFRSDLVHGNAGLATEEIYPSHLSEARDFARAIVLWMLNYLHHVVEHPPGEPQALASREDLLAVLDMDDKSRRHTASVLQNLPADFPNVKGWVR